MAVISLSAERRPNAIRTATRTAIRDRPGEERREDVEKKEPDRADVHSLQDDQLRRPEGPVGQHNEGKSREGEEEGREKLFEEVAVYEARNVLIPGWTRESYGRGLPLQTGSGAGGRESGPAKVRMGPKQVPPRKEELQLTPCRPRADLRPVAGYDVRKLCIGQEGEPQADE